MIIECPSCSAKFKLPDAALDAGPRKMKCSKCAFMWTAHPPKVEAPAPATLAPGPEPVAKPKTPSKLTPLEFALAGFSSVLVAAAVVLAAMVFAPGLLGFKNSNDLGFSAVHITAEKPDGGERFEPTESFIISGEVTNNGSAPKAAPLIRIKALTKSDDVVYTKTVKNDDKIIPPGEVFHFSIGELKRLDPEITRFMVEMGSGYELMLRPLPKEPLPAPHA